MTDDRTETNPGTCPVCGAVIEVEPLDVGGAAFAAVVPGMWRCPNECDPRTVLRGDRSPDV